MNDIESRPGFKLRKPDADEKARLEKLAGDRVDWVCLGCGAFGYGFHVCAQRSR